MFRTGKNQDEIYRQVDQVFITGQTLSLSGRWLGKMYCAAFVRVFHSKLQVMGQFIPVKKLHFWVSRCTCGAFTVRSHATAATFLWHN